MAAPALVALAHGSRDPRSAETINALVGEAKALRWPAAKEVPHPREPGLPVARR